MFLYRSRGISGRGMVILGKGVLVIKSLTYPAVSFSLKPWLSMRIFPGYQKRVYSTCFTLSILITVFLTCNNSGKYKQGLWHVCFFFAHVVRKGGCFIINSMNNYLVRKNSEKYLACPNFHETRKKRKSSYSFILFEKGKNARCQMENKNTILYSKLMKTNRLLSRTPFFCYSIFLVQRS